MMEDEVVTRRRWLKKEAFIDLLGFANLIPGPNSTETAILLGYLRGGRPGLFLAGACFILPAMLIVLAFAMLYQAYGALPAVGSILAGIKPVVIAVVAQALYRLGLSILRKADAAIIAVAVLAASLLGIREIPLLLSAGAAMLGFRLLWNPASGGPGSTGPGSTGSSSRAGRGPRLHAVAPMSVGLIFLVFLKIGSVLYGSGYVLLAFLKTEFIERYGVLTSQQLIDAVAVGQFTPGPVFTTATFIGYLLHGIPGAIAATVGIFLPAFLLVLFLRPLLDRMRASKVLSHVLDGVNAAAIALMAGVTLELGRAALVSLPAVLIFLISAVLLVRFKVNSTWLIIGGGIVGVLLTI